MKITLIYTARQTNLTIDASGASGPLEFARMGPKGEALDKKQWSSGPKEPIRLGPIGPGVYKVTAIVKVTGDITDPQAFVVMNEVETKDPPPDQPKVTLAMAKDKLGKFGVHADALHAFVVDVRGGINISLPGRSSS